jgi:hypothetical protein
MLKSALVAPIAVLVVLASAACGGTGGSSRATGGEPAVTPYSPYEHKMQALGHWLNG